MSRMRRSDPGCRGEDFHRLGDGRTLAILITRSGRFRKATHDRNPPTEPSARSFPPQLRGQQLHDEPSHLGRHPTLGRQI
jgi:hypothetical protein